MDALFPIRAVTQRTGISAHLLRIWERRYGAVRPKRSPTNRRLYSESDIEKLALLRKLTTQGHNIGQVASLPLRKIKELAHLEPTTSRHSPSPPWSIAQDAEGERIWLERALSKIHSLDPGGLEAVLVGAEQEIPARSLLENFLPELLRAVGELWENKSLTISHEHIASAIIRNFLSNLNTAYRPGEDSPAALFGTPPGHDHEIGALLAAKVSASLGWKPLYLGTHVPANEWAETAHFISAQLVALSIPYSPPGIQLKPYFKSMGQKLKGVCPWIVGGRDAENFQKTIQDAGGRVVTQFKEFRRLLEQPNRF